MSTQSGTTNVANGTRGQVPHNVQLGFQILNILDEPNIFYRPTPESLAQADYSGRRYVLGLRARF